MSGLHWTSGDAAVREAIDAWWAAGAEDGVLRANDRRRVARVSDCFVKHFRADAGGHRVRETVKAWLGRSPASREAARLRFLQAHGVPVPTVLGEARSDGGDRLLVLPFVEGRSLLDALGSATAAARRAILAGVGDAVRRLHATGAAHGDLHGENLLCTPGGVVLVDLQHATERASEPAQLQDLGDLDYSLWDRLSTSDRLRIRRAALGGDPTERSRLRAVGAAALRRADAHGRSRTRHATRPGREMARLRLGDWRGLRSRALEADTIARALDAHESALAQGGEAVLKDDGRSAITRVETEGGGLVVKQVHARGLGRIFADLVRGSAGWRAFRGGHGLRVRGIAAARPEAFLERRRLGLPLASIVFLEDLGGAPDAVDLANDAPERLTHELRATVERLHRRSVDHGDLKGTHMLFHEDGERRGPALIDLEGVRFPRRLADARRIAALAELNASIPNGWPATERRRAFVHYACALPFAAGREAALRELVSASLARHHRWSGAGCEATER